MDRYLQPPRCSADSALAEVDTRLEVAARVGVDQRLVQIDPPVLVQLQQRHVEALYAALGAEHDRFLDPDDIGLLDQIGDVRRVKHHFHRRYALAALTRHQTLREDGAQI